ncbi:SMEK domain-containing protein [Bacillus thuringiensis]|uniref:SMEK domain-containing protein n=1 Tax=Bacillus thuringiensis TaxID=1428 RepID=UPI0021D66C8E|nr:SMEK domain-containing protein [Bacillus thuringiensis]MCU7667724.1 SMEK domain-containing protein [Bacillus thuringiensis]
MTYEEKLREEINRALTWIESSVRIESKQGYYNKNKDAENLFCGLLNLIHGYDLKNLNYESQNTPGIDLGDKQSRICYQITSQNTRDKIKESIEKFQNHKFNNTYDELIILIIGYKKKFHPFKNDEYDFKLKVIGIEEIGKEINEMSIEEKEEILKHLNMTIPDLIQYESEYTDVVLKTGKNYASFLDFFSDEEYHDEDTIFINEFAETLSELDSKTRKLIYKIMKHSTEVEDDGIHFDYYEVFKHLKWEEDTFLKELNLLQHKDLIDTPRAELDIMDRIHDLSDKEKYEKDLVRLSYDKDCIELLSNIYKFLKDEADNKKDFKASLKRLIMKLDFTLLD